MIIFWVNQFRLICHLINYEPRSDLRLQHTLTIIKVGNSSCNGSRNFVLKEVP